MKEPLDLSKKRPGPWDDSEENTIYKVNVEENMMGELYIELPRELMENLNWYPGDNLIWEECLIGGDHAEYSAATVSKKKDWDNENKK